MAASWTLVRSPKHAEKMLIQLRSPTAPSWPAVQWYCYCFTLYLMSPENECDTPAQEDIKQLCGDLCKLEGKMQSSDFLDFVVSEVEHGAGCHYKLKKYILG